MIDQRASALARQLDAERSSCASAAAAAADALAPGGSANHHGPGSGGGARGQLAVQFFEKRRRKAWLSRGDDDICWESWTVKVTVAEPCTEGGTPSAPPSPVPESPLTARARRLPERAKVRRAMEQTLLTTAMKIVTFANSHKDHIPPITTQGGNPFPFKINLDHKGTGWAARMRIY